MQVFLFLSSSTLSALSVFIIPQLSRSVTFYDRCEAGMDYLLNLMRRLILLASSLRLISVMLLLYHKYSLRTSACEFL